MGGVYIKRRLGVAEKTRQYSCLHSTVRKEQNEFQLLPCAGYVTGSHRDDLDVTTLLSFVVTVIDIDVLTFGVYHRWFQTMVGFLFFRLKLYLPYDFISKEEKLINIVETISKITFIINLPKTK